MTHGEEGAAQGIGHFPADAQGVFRESEVDVPGGDTQQSVSEVAAHQESGYVTTLEEFFEALKNGRALEARSICHGRQLLLGRGVA
jgi:hypothetical protein